MYHNMFQGHINGPVMVEEGAVYTGKGIPASIFGFLKSERTNWSDCDCRSGIGACGAFGSYAAGRKRSVRDPL